MGIRTEPAINTSLLSSVQTKADKDTEQAVRQALEDNDIQTVFFVNLISRDQQESTSRNVNDSAYYLSTRVERTVFDATKEEKLPKDRSLESALSRSSYRARVFDFLMTTTPWLAFDATAGTSKDLEVNGDYHHDKTLYQNEVQSAVTASTYPDGVPTRLEYVSKQIAEVVSLTSNVEPAVKRFWVLVTSVSTSGTVARPLLRAYQFVFEKTIPDNEEESKLTFSFNLYATIFNENDFEAARESIDSSLIDLGKALVRQKSTDIYLPALSSQT